LKGLQQARRCKKVQGALNMYDSQERLILGFLIVIYFFFLFGVSLYINKKSIKTYDDFNVAGRSVSLFPLILTFVGTAVGGATLLGFMENGFLFGMSQQWLNFSIFLAGVVMLAFFLKKFVRLVKSMKWSLLQILRY
jgi:Na+/proline symporter